MTNWKRHRKSPNIGLLFGNLFHPVFLREVIDHWSFEGEL